MTATALGIVGYFSYQLRRQEAEIARLRAIAERAASAREPSSRAPTVVRYVESKSPAAAVASAPGTEPTEPPSTGEDEPEPSEEELAAAQEGRLARMLDEFRAQPLDTKAPTTQNKLELAVEAAAGELSDASIQRGPIECRTGWCSMPFQYGPSSDLDRLHAALSQAARKLPGESKPLLSRLTQPSADGSSREGRYFFRWKQGTW